jgi:hypothetical protein
MVSNTVALMAVRELKPILAWPKVKDRADLEGGGGAW